MNLFEQLPSRLVRGEIFPYLDSLDILALRYTCKSLKFDTTEERSYLAHATDRSTKYWRWLYDIVECWCHECQPVKLYIYYLCKLAKYRTVAAFFNSPKYHNVARHSPRTLETAMLGACARSDLRTAKLVRGCSPALHYPKEKVLNEACKSGNVKLFSWLVDIGDLPNPDCVHAFETCITIGTNGSLSMLRTLVSRGFPMETDHWWLVCIHALRLRHHNLLRYLYTYAPVTLYTRRFMMASITYDNPIAFRVNLENGVAWPTVEDSTHLMLYNAKAVATYWYALGFPMSPAVRNWYARWADL